MILSKLKIILIILLTLVCCKEYGRLKFISGNKTKLDLKRKIFDKKITLYISGHIGGTPDKRCVVGLGITVKYSKLAGQLSFHPDSLLVILNSEDMLKSKAYMKKSYPIEEEGYYYVSVNFIEKQDSMALLEETANFKIILNKFIYYNEQAIPIDTIYAYYPD